MATRKLSLAAIRRTASNLPGVEARLDRLRAADLEKLLVRAMASVPRQRPR